MSTQAGGAADKLGNRHEALWGVAAMLRVLFGQASSVRIEEPGQHGAEFYLQTTSGREYWQAKRQVSKQKDWTISLLRSEGVLAYFRQQTAQGHRCVFASVSDAVDFRGLAENARDIPAWHEFQAHVLSSKQWHKPFSELNSLMGFADEEATYRFLRQIRVENAAERTLEQTFLLPCLASRFVDTPSTVLSALIDYYETSVHQTLTAEDILRHLTKEPHSFKERTFDLNPSVIARLQRITAAYLAGQRGRLIGRKPIPRHRSAEIVSRILVDKDSSNIIITAGAGGGKSAALLQIVEGLETAGMPVMAFRLDTLSDPAAVTSTLSLGQAYGLPESPALVLSKAFPQRPVALVIDQLDFISASSGRHSDLFDVVAALAEEIQGLRVSGQQVHLIMACRQFDFKNDSRIQRLLSEGASPDIMPLLTSAEVQAAIQSEGGDFYRLSDKQKALLEVPQNLSLFIESGLVTKGGTSFVGQKQLMDAYWDFKREAVSKRDSTGSEQWPAVMHQLSEEMSRRQVLSVPKNHLDSFFPACLNAMVSEGVLILEPQGYRFGHESLFDYCFARGVAAKRDVEFIEDLEKDPQELFRRTQLRQLLVYLRDEEAARYLRNVRRTLTSKDIRPHLKLLVVQLLLDFSDPTDAEWEIISPLLNSDLSFRCRSAGKPEWLASQAWTAFVRSDAWFQLACRRGSIPVWLGSHEGAAAEAVVKYLARHATEHGNEVATLLEPWVDKSREWNIRLENHLPSPWPITSRRFFELVLRVLDQSGGPMHVGHAFWCLVNDDGSKWAAELAARWLDRKVGLLTQAGTDPYLTSLGDEISPQSLLETARRAPAATVKHVLPAVLRAAEAFPSEALTAFIEDRFWYTISIDDDDPHLDTKEAFPRACVIALTSLAHSSSADLRPAIALLRATRLDIANELLLKTYALCPDSFADEALTLLADEPARMAETISSRTFEHVVEVLQNCSVHCSPEVFKRIEAAALAYKPPRSTEHDDESHVPTACFLTSALAARRRSPEARDQLKKWKRAHGYVKRPSFRSGSFAIVSPVPRDEAERFSDDQWISEMEKYSVSLPYDPNHPGRRGSEELARLFQDFVQGTPERFAQLSRRFTPATHADYWSALLLGLATDSCPSSLKVEVARRSFDLAALECLRSALSLLASVTDMPLPEDALDFIRRMATDHPDPGPELRGESIVLDTVRGRAVDAMRQLISNDHAYMELFREPVTRCMGDPSLVVRSRSAALVLAISDHDPSWALELFEQLLKLGDGVLSLEYCTVFIHRTLRTSSASSMQPVIRRMMLSSDEKVRESGGILASLACLYQPQLGELAETALAGDAPCRRGAAAVASKNIHQTDLRPWCESALMRLFNDEDLLVRQKAARCFSRLAQLDIPFAGYDSLIRSFLASPSAELATLLDALHATRQRVPHTVLDACAAFFNKIENSSARRPSSSSDDIYVNRLLFRAYAQLDDSLSRARALDLIDKLCEAGMSQTEDCFAEFER